MSKLPVVLDLETKHTFREVQNDHKKLGVSVVGIYDLSTNQEKVFEEKELSGLFPILEKASYVIGFNINGFDLPVLQVYYPGNLSRFHTFDILDDVKERIGRRLALNDIVYATLGKKKSGHGLIAIEHYKEGKMDELRSYCLDDVMLTKELFEYGIRHHEINYLNEKGKVSIPVNWKKYMETEGNNETPLTLPS